MEGNEEEDLLLSSFSLCHSLNSISSTLSEYILKSKPESRKPKEIEYRIREE
jgi:hypothetical protein